MNEEKNAAGAMKAASPYLTLGVQLAAAVVVFLFVGKYLDRKFETTPWLMVAGAAVGFIGGMIKFMRTVLVLSKKEEDERRNKN